MLFVVLIGGFFVFAWSPNPGHDGADVGITIGGNDYTLQEAIDAGLLGGSSGGASVWDLDGNTAYYDEGNVEVRNGHSLELKGGLNDNLGLTFSVYNGGTPYRWQLSARKLNGEPGDLKLLDYSSSVWHDYITVSRVNQDVTIHKDLNVEDLNVDGDFSPMITIQKFDIDYNGCTNLGMWAFCYLSREYSSYSNVVSCSVDLDSLGTESVRYQGESSNNWQLCNMRDEEHSVDCRAICVKFE